MAIMIVGTGATFTRCCGCRNDEPCGTPWEASIACRSAEASLTKCGFEEWPGYESTPPKIYLLSTIEGTLYAESTDNNCQDCETRIVYNYSGSASYQRISCSFGNNRTLATAQYYPDCTTLQETSSGSVSDIGFTPDTFFPNSYTSTIHSVTGAGCVDTGTAQEAYYYGTATNTLSNEYTTADLLDDVDSELPDFSGDFGTPCEPAVYDITSDELTITKRKIQYKFTWPISLTASLYSCYKIEWAEVFTPESGSVVTTARSYQWNGTDIETPVYTIDVPTYQGTTVVTSITTSCACS